MTAVEAIIALAKDECGYLEKATGDVKYLYDKTANAGRNNYTKYGYELASTDIFNGSKFGYEWCTSFICWLWYHLYGQQKTHDSLKIPSRSSAAGCVYFVQYLKAAKRYGSTPQIGSLIFFKDSDGDPCHIGIVYGWDSTTVWTIEGNTSGASGVVANGGGVCKKSYSRSYSRIHGYGYPDYSVLGDVKPVAKTTKVYSPMKAYTNRSSATPVFKDSDFAEQTGKLNPNEKCYCSGWYGYQNGSKAYAICYKLDGYTDRWAVGYVNNSGGITD